MSVAKVSEVNMVIAIKMHGLLPCIHKGSIGGNLVFDRLKIENTLSLFEVIGDLSFVQKSEIRNLNVELKIYADYNSRGITRRNWIDTAIRESDVELTKCGLSNYGQPRGHDQKIYYVEPSTFAALRTMRGEFTSLL